MTEKNHTTGNDNAKSKEERVGDTLERMDSMEQIDDSQIPQSVLNKFKQSKDDDCN
jgi:hypothetical protein